MALLIDYEGTKECLCHLSPYKGNGGLCLLLVGIRNDYNGMNMVSELICAKVSISPISVYTDISSQVLIG